MATKRPSAKKSTKKSAAKKPAKKSTQRLAGDVTPAAGFPINLRCILACVTQYNSCIKKGVARETCELRLQRCIRNCMGVRGTNEPGLIDE